MGQFQIRALINTGSEFQTDPLRKRGTHALKSLIACIINLYPYFVTGIITSYNLRVGASLQVASAAWA